MQTAEPLVPGFKGHPVIDIEEPVVQIMIAEISDGDGEMGELDLFKTTMGPHRVDGQPLQKGEGMKRMGGQDPAEHDSEEVENVLDRVHRDAGPGTGVGILVM